MLYNFKWLQNGNVFPPECEEERIERYKQNAALFDGDHFKDPSLRSTASDTETPINVYIRCANRISRVIGNFEDVVSFPTLLNYQRLTTLKTADLVCGERPNISGSNEELNQKLQDIADSVGFYDKLFSSIIDISRYGEAIWRIYRDDDDKNTFTCWNPTQWYPIVAQDGTNSILYHCLCWRVNESEDPDNPNWVLYVQKHGCKKPEIGFYIQETYQMDSLGTTIEEQLSSEKVSTGLTVCAIQQVAAFKVTSSVYGYDDYLPIDSLLAEIMARVGQIAAILDKHADPCLTGPTSMLTLDPITGEYRLEAGKFFGVSPGEEHPAYLTWDGHLEAAFKHLEFLVNQLYILSEMGSALLGGQDGSATAISGTAMRFKMVNPLAKARRITNSLTLPIRKLFEALDSSISYKDVSVFWADGLPDDPRENIENAKLATGEQKMMPLKVAIREFFNRSPKEADEWIKSIKEESLTPEDVHVNHSGPQDGTGVNSSEKGSELGLTNFSGLNN